MLRLLIGILTALTSQCGLSNALLAIAPAAATTSASRAFVSLVPPNISRRGTSPSFTLATSFYNIRIPKIATSSLSLLPLDISEFTTSSSLLLCEDTTTTATLIAEALGYLIGAASILLYAPIAVRIVRTKSANGLTVSTWWLKLVSFTCTDVYNIRSGYGIAAFSETLVLTLEAAVVLGLVSYYQTAAAAAVDNAAIDTNCGSSSSSSSGSTLTALALPPSSAYLLLSSWALFAPETESWGPTQQEIAGAQVLATVLSTSALLPQLKQNYDRRSPGDYSPITASLAAVGCTVRLFTTVELASGDPLLLLNYGVGLVLNVAVLVQVVYYGVRLEGRSLVSLFLADVATTSADAKE